MDAFLSRRAMLSLTTGTGLAVASGLAAPAAAARPHPAGPRRLHLAVALELSTLRTVHRPREGNLMAEGPFHLEGRIEHGGEAIGRFRCTGWTQDGGSLPPAVDSLRGSFELSGQGTLEFQGLASLQSALVGGLGAFRGARGIVRFEDVDLSRLAFRAVLELDD